MIIRRGGGSPELPAEFTTAPSSPLHRAMSAPSGVVIINLLGFPLTAHFRTPLGRLRHRQMARYGPNDGLGLLRDAIIEPGLTYPVWGADHYFRVPTVPVLLAPVIAYLIHAGCSSASFRESGNQSSCWEDSMKCLACLSLLFLLAGPSSIAAQQPEALVAHHLPRHQRVSPARRSIGTKASEQDRRQRQQRRPPAGRPSPSRRPGRARPAARRGRPRAPRSPGSRSAGRPPRAP